jgi:RHS repeat-associated protein
MNRPSSILFSSEFHVGYRYAFNGKETETTVNTGAYDFGARMYDGRLGRWWSVDGLQSKYPFSSTFCFALNSSLALIDRDGNENIIYLVIVPSASSANPKIDIEQIKKEMESRCEIMMMKTKVVVFDRPNEAFDPRNLDKHDTFLLIGTVKDTRKYYEENQLNDKYLVTDSGKQYHDSFIDFDHLEADKKVVETACGQGSNRGPHNNGGGVGGVIPTDRMDYASNNFGISITQSMALLALHVAFGHNANSNHDCSAPLVGSGCEIARLLNPKAPICLAGDVLQDQKVETLSLENFYFESSMYEDFMKHAQERYGTQKAKDNYDANKEKCSDH